MATKRVQVSLQTWHVDKRVVVDLAHVRRAGGEQRSSMPPPRVRLEHAEDAYVSYVAQQHQIAMQGSLCRESVESRWWELARTDEEADER